MTVLALYDAAAATTEAAWIMAVTFTVCFLGVIALGVRLAARNRPASRAELETRIRQAEQDEIVAAHRRRIAGTLD